jgi:solute carrier family 15 (oligopeptide transporter), member 1
VSNTISQLEAKSDTQLASANNSHPTGFWFFFWGEFAERCSYYGMRAILALYMTDRLGVDKADAGTFMSLFIAACYFFPLIGGWLADNYLGKYWTIVGFSIPYVVAQFMVGIENKYLVFISLMLLAMGSGVIKPNISTLMGMTYDQQRPGQDQLRTSAFSWFYMAINIGAALSQFAMPWLRDEMGYQVAFIFPAALMAIALIIFAMGKRHYAVETIQRRTMTTEEAIADRRLKKETLLRIGAVFLLVMFFWAIFDQAASTWIFFADTYMDCTIFGIPTSADAIQGFNPVFIVLLIPVSVALFKVVEIKATTKMLIGFVLTVASMLIMSLAGFLAGKSTEQTKIVFDNGHVIVAPFTVPLSDVASQGATLAAGDEKASPSEADWKFNSDTKKLTFTSGTLWLPGGEKLEVKEGQLMNAVSDLPVSDRGILAMSLQNASAEPSPDAKREVSIEKIDWVKPAERVTVWWQVLAYLILTVAEILISVTGLELAFVAAPPSMKSFVTACWLAVVFLANLLINAPITRLYTTMPPGQYFAMLAIAMAVVAFVFVFVAARFNRSMAQASATS